MRSHEFPVTRCFHQRAQQSHRLSLIDRLNGVEYEQSTPSTPVPMTSLSPIQSHRRISSVLGVQSPTSRRCRSTAMMQVNVAGARGGRTETFTHSHPSRACLHRIILTTSHGGSGGHAGPLTYVANPQFGPKYEQHIPLAQPCPLCSRINPQRTDHTAAVTDRQNTLKLVLIYSCDPVLSSTVPSLSIFYHPQLASAVYMPRGPKPSCFPRQHLSSML